MEITFCEKHGQSFLSDPRNKKCPDCILELREEIMEKWFKSREDEPEHSKQAAREKAAFELNIIDRLERTMKRVPAACNIDDNIVVSTRQIPIAQRDDFSYKVETLLSRLRSLYYWWDKVADELKKPPEIKLYDS